MHVETPASGSDRPVVLYHWSARKLQPVILVYVAAVFGVLMAGSYFLLHSPTAVKALASPPPRGPPVRRGVAFPGYCVSFAGDLSKR